MMSFIKKPLTSIVLGMALISGSASAQYKHTVDPFFSSLSNKLRWEIGGNGILATGEFTGVVRVADGGIYRGDSTATRTMSADPGFGVTLGLSMPFKGTGHISNWAAHIELQVNQYMWKNLNQTMTSGGKYVNGTTPVNATTMQYALPIGVEWKVGTDAILSKRLNFGATLGAGVIPQYNVTNLEGLSNIDPGHGWGFRPYAKAEIAIFTGFCWKLRGMYSPGNVNLLDVNRKLTNSLSDGPFTIRNTGNVILSLIIMPWSVRWQEYDWWNTYDTYNQHDRFN
jgi:hypothetical protein